MIELICSNVASHEIKTSLLAYQLWLMGNPKYKQGIRNFSEKESSVRLNAVLMQGKLQLASSLVIIPITSF